MPKIKDKDKAAPTTTPEAEQPKKPLFRTTENREPAPEQPQPGPTTALVKHEWDQQTAVVPISPPSSGEKVPWLRFYSGNAKNAADVRKALRNINEGEAYLAIPEDGSTQYVELRDFFLVQCREFYTKMELNGMDYKLTAATLADPGRDSGYDRELIAFCLALVDGELIPCVASFRGAKAPAAQQMYHAIQSAGGNWRAVVGSLNYTLRTAKKSGRNYTIANAEIRPIDARVAGIYKVWDDDADAKDEASRVYTSYKAKCAEIENKARETAGQ